MSPLALIPHSINDDLYSFSSISCKTNLHKYISLGSPYSSKSKSTQFCDVTLSTKLPEKAYFLLTLS